MNQFKSSANNMSAHPIKSFSKVASLSYAWKCTEITAVCCICLQMQTNFLGLFRKENLDLKKPNWLN